MKKIIASFWVDPQNCFTSLCPGELPVPQAQEIVPALLAQREYAQYQIISVDAHPINALWETTDPSQIAKPISPQIYPNIDAYWPRHAIEGSFGQTLIAGLPDLNIENYDCIVEKGKHIDCHPYGAMYLDLEKKGASPALHFLKDKHITHVIIAGLATEFCVLETVLQLLEQHVTVIVNLTGCRGFPDTAEAAVKHMEKAGALIAKTTNIIHRLLA
jgi:nicotinamidase/pyrazinamidase